MRSALVVLLWGSLVGCSSTFNRDWYQYVPSDSADGVIGRWDGSWKSYRTERQGHLRCIISRQAEGRYVARYQATVRRWWSRHYEYTVLMKAEPGGDGRILKGSRDFGWAAGGIFHYRGEIDGDVFKCLYSAEEDRGVFELTRYSGDASPSPP